MASPLPATDPTAVFARRVVATLIDAALILVPTFLLLTATFEYRDVSALDRDPQQWCDDYMNADLGFCANFADVNDRVYTSDGPDPATHAMYWGGSLVLLVVVQGLTGFTVGKLLTGIRTVREDGRPPGVGRAFVRWVMWAVDAFPYVIPLLGPIVAGTTQGHRRVGDMVAKTFVVRASAAGAPIVVPGVTTPAPGLVTYAGTGAWGSQPAPWTPAGQGGDAGTGGWAAPGTAPTTPGVDGPQWDAARNTYIQWDPAQRRWLQWDESARTWSVIPGQ
jgi:uncharacterized RDD family membrane protein YckC